MGDLSLCSLDTPLDPPGGAAAPKLKQPPPLALLGANVGLEAAPAVLLVLLVLESALRLDELLVLDVTLDVSRPRASSCGGSSAARLRVAMARR